MLLLKNWLGFVRGHTFLFILMMLAQLVSILCIYFVYGVFQNNMYILLEGEHDSYRLAASLDEHSTLKNPGDLIREMAEEWGYDMEFVYITAENGKKEEYQDRVSYSEGKFSYSGTVAAGAAGNMEGRFPLPDEYAAGRKVVVVGDGSKAKIDDKITLHGEAYRVIGINRLNDREEYEMPFTSFPRNARVTYLSVSMKELPTREQYDRFAEAMRLYHGEVEDFAIQNNEDLKKQYSLLLVSVLLALLSGGNLFIVYCYIFKQRKKQLMVFRLQGCTKRRARHMFFLEISLNLAITTVTGLILYRFVIYPILARWYEYLYRIYNERVYAGLTAVFVGITLLFGWIISQRMTRESIVEFKREV